MPKQFTAQRIHSLSNFIFEIEGGNVIGLKIICEVNYGEIGLTELIDIWQDITPENRHIAQTLYELIKRKVEAIILD